MSNVVGRSVLARSLDHRRYSFSIDMLLISAGPPAPLPAADRAANRRANHTSSALPASAPSRPIDRRRNSADYEKFAPPPDRSAVKTFAEDQRACLRC